MENTTVDGRNRSESQKFINLIILFGIMADWESLYKEKGIVQKGLSKFVKEAVEFFKQQNLEKILDLGCGTGRHTLYLLKNGFKVYGCDASESALKIAKEIVKNVKFKKCDMISLPYEDNYFDGILCHFVIQHGKIEQIKKAISEIYRVLKKDGILYLSVPSVKHPEYFTGEEIEPNTKININAIDGNVPHHYFIENEIRNLLNKFDIIKLKHVEFLSERGLNKKAAAYLIYVKK